MNPFCECPATGFCNRHQKMKGAEQFARCQGTALTPDCGLKYWNAWEQGRAGATAPDTPMLNPPGFCGDTPKKSIEYKSSVGDMLSEIIKRETGKQIPCQACQADIDKLNSLTVEECQAQKEGIVSNIYIRAFENASVMLKAGMMLDKLLHTGVTVSVIGGWFDEALTMGVEKKKKSAIPSSDLMRLRGIAAKVAKLPTSQSHPKSIGIKSRKFELDRLHVESRAAQLTSDGIHTATEEQQATRLAICEACPVYNAGWCDESKGGCGCNLALKVKARAAFCPQGKWFAHTDNYRPLVNPTRSLIFHIYPIRKRGDWWRWHVEQIRKHADKFNGKIVIGVVVGSDTETIEDVQAAFAGIKVNEWIVKQNSKLAETLTQVDLFRAVMTDDPNAIVFRSHCKGITKQPGSIEETWARIMWDANMDISSVEDALASHLVACVLRSQTPLVQRKPGGWFAAGSAYWFRAKEAFERDWSWSENNRWAIEYWPAHVFRLEESACMFHDLTPSSVLRDKYFDDHVNPEFALWQQARGIV